MYMFMYMRMLHVFVLSKYMCMYMQEESRDRSIPSRSCIVWLGNNKLCYKSMKNRREDKTLDSDLESHHLLALQCLGLVSSVHCSSPACQCTLTCV